MDKLAPPKPLYWAAVAFISGIFTAEYIPSLSAVPLLVILVFLALVYITLFSAKYGIRLRIIILLLICFISGIWRLDATRQLPGNHIANIQSDDADVYAVGVVIEEPVIYQPQPSPLYEERFATKPYGYFILDASAISIGDTSKVNGLVRVNFSGDHPGIKYGDFVGVTGIMSAPASPTNPGEFNYHQYLARQGIYKIIKCKAAGITVITEGQGNPLLRLVYGIRRAISDKIDSAFSRMTPDIPAFSRAMFLGDRAGFPEGIVDKFIRTGTVHYISVSGAHLVIVLGIFYVLCSWLGIIGLARVVLLLLVSVLYAGITGLYTPISRALIMLICYFGAEIFNRKANAINSLALAAIIIASYNPYEVFSTGTQLSFVAVLFIVVFTPGLLRLIHKPSLEDGAISRLLPPTLSQRLWQAVKRYFIDTLSVSVVVWGGLVLLTLHYFNIINPIAIVANIVLSFLITVFMFSGFMTLPLLWVIPAVPVFILSVLTGLIYKLTAWLSYIPGASFYLPDIPGWFAGLFYGLFFAGLLLVGKSRCVRFLAIGVRSAMVLMMGLTTIWIIWTGISGRSLLYRVPDSVTLTMLDVRQGAAFVIETPDGKIALFDAGTFGSRDIGKNIIAPYLWQRGISRIDKLILSHPHPDHINGVPSLVDRFRIGEVAVNSYFANDDVGQRVLKMFSRPPRVIRIGELWPLGNHLTARVLGPPEGLGYNKGYWNDTSLVLRLNSEALLCGDIEKGGIEWLMGNLDDNFGIKILQIPHHGFSSSFVPEFIRMVKPSYAFLNSDCKRLAEGLLELCSDNRIKVLSSREHGAVTVIFRQSGLEITTYKNSADDYSDE